MEKVNDCNEISLVGFALSINGGEDFKFPCPICDEEVEVDDFYASYRCNNCNAVVNFSYENIKEL